jgi:hypothetical protein
MKQNYNSRYLHSLTRSLLKSRNPEIELAKTREIVAASEYGLLQSRLKKVHRGTERPFGTLLSPSFLDLLKATPPSELDYERELKWAKATFGQYALEIAAFLKSKQEFSISLLRGDYDGAKSSLDNVERVFGQSLWLIKSRLALLQTSLGLEAQKRYAQQVKEEVAYNGPVALVTQWVSARNENTVTAPRLVADFEQLVARMAEQIPEGWVHYLRYHVLNPESLTVDAGMHVLRLESTRALVDYYEAFIRLGRLVSLAGDTKQKSYMGYAIKRIIPRVIDSRLNVLLAAVGKVPTSHTEPSTLIKLEVYDAYRSGRYEDAHLKVQAALAENPADAVLLALAALAHTFTQDSQKETASISISTEAKEKSASPFYQTLLEHLVSLAKRGAIAGQELHELAKVGQNFGHLDWSAALLLLVNDETTASLLASPASANAALQAAQFHPWLVEAMGQAHVSNAYLEATAENADISTIGWPFALNYLEGTGAKEPVVGLSTDSTHLLNGIQSYTSHNYEQAASHGESLVNSQYAYYQRRGYRLKANSLLSGGNLLDAFNYLAQVYVREPLMHPMLPIAQAVGELHPRADSWRHLRGTLALSILLDAYGKYAGKTADLRCSYAYEDFLLANSLKRPSQLKQISKQFDGEQLLYYLRYVCVESIMDVSTEYDTSQEVASERLAVCRVLTELDPTNEEFYRQEINELLRQQVINKRKKEVEQSKIHVELDKLHSWGIAQLQEGFNRYVTFLRVGLDAESQAVRSEAAAKAAELDIKGLMAMSVPDNEPRALFRSLVLELRDAYTSSTEFGLDRYLSTRIRHGALAAQLRRPLTTHHIITQRERKDGPYQENVYWTSRLALSANDKEELNVIFDELSNAYDELINKIRMEWVQVRRNAEQVGLFEFSLADGEFTLLATEVNDDTTFRQFSDLIVEYLGERLTFSLASIRKRLREEAKPAARDLLNNLQKRITSLLIPYSSVLSELDAAIAQARTETDAAFDRITEWFRPTQAVGSTPYNMEDVISVAEALVQEMQPSFQVPLQVVNDDTLFLLANGFPTLVDVFSNILENVIKHSGLVQPEARAILDHTTLASGIDVVSVKVINSLSPSVDRIELASQLAIIRQKLDEGKYGSSIATEGGSGFFKIHRSLRDFRLSDKEAETTLSFGITDDEFVIEVLLPMRWLTALAPSEDPTARFNALLDLRDESTPS